MIDSAIVEAIAWTAIALLGAAVLSSFGGFFYLGTRIDAQGARLDTRIDNQGARIDRLGEEIAALTTAVNTLTTGWTRTSRATLADSPLVRPRGSSRAACDRRVVGEC
jgi:hypothetical protein